MICKCGGILEVIRLEYYPKEIKDKVSYQRVCDVKCIECGKEFYSQPYDFGRKFNVVKDLSN